MTTPDPIATLIEEAAAWRARLLRLAIDPADERAVDLLVADRWPRGEVRRLERRAQT